MLICIHADEVDGGRYNQGEMPEALSVSPRDGTRPLKHPTLERDLLKCCKESRCSAGTCSYNQLFNRDDWVTRNLGLSRISARGRTHLQAIGALRHGQLYRQHDRHQRLHQGARRQP